MYVKSPQSGVSIEERTKILNRIIIGVLVIMLLRLFYLQVITGHEYRSQAENNRLRIIHTRTPRGIVYDQANIPLATNRRVFSVFFDPVGANQKEREQTYQKLVRILLDHNAAFADELSRKGEPVNQLQPRRVAEDVSFETIAALRENSLDLPGVYVKDEFIRYYPLGNGTAHLLGYLRKISIEKLQKPQFQDYEMNDQVGQNGLEELYEKYLRGRSGGWMIEVDAHGRKRRDVGLQPSIPGNNLVLNINYRLQKKAYELLQGKRGTIIAMNPNTGEVLAMVSEPSYDSNLMSGPITQNQWSEILNDPGNPMQNRAIMGSYPPGSVFKLITATAGMETKAVTPKTVFSCTGTYPLGNWVFHCSHVHGSLDLTRAISLSCNIYFYKTAQLVGIQRLLELAHQFCLGRTTGIDLLDERAGFLPSEKWKKKNRREGWFLGDTVQLGIGQGFLLVTPLQMVNLVSTIANGGTVYKPFIVKQIEDGSGKVVKRMNPQILNKMDIPPDILEVLHKGMWGVVNGAGTAGLARLPGFEIAGKTGTAQSGWGGKDHAWFCGYGPYQAPKITVLALVEGGGFGGVAAAPLAREMFRTYDNIQKGIPEPVVNKPVLINKIPLELDTTAKINMLDTQTTTNKANDTTSH